MKSHVLIIELLFESLYSIAGIRFLWFSLLNVLICCPSLSRVTVNWISLYARSLNMYVDKHFSVSNMLLKRKNYSLMRSLADLSVVRNILGCGPKHKKQVDYGPNVRGWRSQLHQYVSQVFSSKRHLFGLKCRSLATRTRLEARQERQRISGIIGRTCFCIRGHLWVCSAFRLSFLKVLCFRLGCTLPPMEERCPCLLLTITEALPPQS